MAAVDPLFAQWLQKGADEVLRSDATATARWGSTAVATERVTAIATRAAAAVEADRELAFFSRGPFGLDVHQLVGTDWIAAIGTVVTLVQDDLGYAGGLDVFVIEASVDRNTGVSTVTVLCPLRRLS